MQKSISYFLNRCLTHDLPSCAFDPQKLDWYMWLYTCCHVSQALLDGLQHPEIEKLASAGTWGQFPSHCNRDLLRWLGPMLEEAPLVETVKVPVVDTKNNKKITIDLQLQLPHDIFHYYSHKRPQEFRQFFGSPEQVQHYWQQIYKILHMLGIQLWKNLIMGGWQFHAKCILMQQCWPGMTLYTSSVGAHCFAEVTQHWTPNSISHLWWKQQLMLKLGHCFSESWLGPSMHAYKVDIQIEIGMEWHFHPPAWGVD